MPFHYDARPGRNSQPRPGARPKPAPTIKAPTKEPGPWVLRPRPCDVSRCELSPAWPPTPLLPTGWLKALPNVRSREASSAQHRHKDSHQQPRDLSSRAGRKEQAPVCVITLPHPRSRHRTVFALPQGSPHYLALRPHCLPPLSPCGHGMRASYWLRRPAENQPTTPVLLAFWC